MGLPGWLGDSRRSNNRRSQQHERRLAAETGGRVSAGSGSSWRAPQDVRSDTHLIQHKFTDRDSFTVTIHEWRTIVADARRAGREPALVINFDKHGERITVTES